MKIFVAGASGAIGQPLIAELVRQGHTVTGMSRDKANTQQLVDAVYDGTKLSGASNDKAKKAFNFKPRRLQWLNQ